MLLREVSGGRSPVKEVSGGQAVKVSNVRGGNSVRQKREGKRTWVCSVLSPAVNVEGGVENPFAMTL